MTVHRLVPRPPTVPAEGGLPAGITVYAQGEVPKRTGARNLLEAAAMSPERDAAVALIMGALCIKPSDVSKLNLPSRVDWQRLPECARLQFIGDWLRAEAMELMDFVSFDKPVTMTLGD